MTVRQGTPAPGWWICEFGANTGEIDRLLQVFPREGASDQKPQRQSCPQHLHRKVKLSGILWAVEHPQVGTATPLQSKPALGGILEMRAVSKAHARAKMSVL